MSKIIENLWLGEIAPCDERIKSSSVRLIEEKLEKIKSKILENMSPEKQKEVEKFESVHLDYCEKLRQDAFRKGFSFAVKMLLCSID